MQIAPLALFLCVLGAFAVKPTLPSSNKDRQKKVSRQGAKLAKRESSNQYFIVQHVDIFFSSHCSCVFSHSCSVRRGGRYSYSKRSSIAIRPVDPQVTANRFDQRSAALQFKQPSSTSTVSLSTAPLSTSTTKSDAMHVHLIVVSRSVLGQLQ